MYRETTGHCHHMEHKCHGLGHSHGECRITVYGSYKQMAQSCAALHCFEIPDPPCIPEDCLCPDLAYCHRSVDGGAYMTDPYGAMTIHEGHLRSPRRPLQRKVRRLVAGPDH